MANYTSNFNLTKPLPTELYDIEVFNENMEKIDTVLSSVPTLLTGTSIPENSDLNTYIEVGNYCCSQSNVVSTIANCPVSNAFNMKVFYANGSVHYIAQELIDFSTGVRYYRFYVVTSAKWQNWNTDYTTSNKPTAEELGVPDASGAGNVIFGTDDLNEWTAPGFYATTSTTSNYPSDAGTAYASVLVFGARNNPKRMTQIYIPWVNAKMGLFYTRYCDNGSWTDWNVLYSTKNRPYKYGTSDLTAGTSTLATGEVYLTYE